MCPEVLHRAGSKHANADALTRGPTSDTVPDNATIFVAESDELWKTLDDLAEAQKVGAWWKSEYQAWKKVTRPRHEER